MGAKKEIFKAAAEALAVKCEELERENAIIEQKAREGLQQLRNLLTDEQLKCAELTKAVRGHKALMDLIKQGLEIKHLPLPSNTETGFSSVAEVRLYSWGWTPGQKGSNCLGSVEVVVRSAGERNGGSVANYHLALIPFATEAELYPPLRFVEVPPTAPAADTSADTSSKGVGLP